MDLNNVKKSEIKSDDSYGNGIVNKFEFKLKKKISVKVVNGNLFKKKIRRIKIILQNNEYFENDMILHRINHNKVNIFSNEETPVSSLLNNFLFHMNKKDNTISQKLINASCKTIKFLEKFYKC